jgi:hypothetical protein
MGASETTAMLSMDHPTGLNTGAKHVLSVVLRVWCSALLTAVTAPSVVNQKHIQCVVRDGKTATGSQDEETVQFTCESKVFSWQMGALLKMICKQSSNPEWAACFKSSARSDVTQLASHC